MARIFTHWIAFDPSNMKQVRAVFIEARRVLILRAYNHPSNMSFSVLEVQSTDAYETLDLDVNSGSSPLRRLPRKPTGLGKGMTVEAFENIYGSLSQ